MHIINIMLSSGAGGIEQACVDYCEGLLQRGHTVTAIVSPNATILPQLKRIGCGVELLAQHGKWDMVALWRLRRMLRRLKSQAIIAHGNRAFYFAQQAGRGRVPVVAVTHNYSTKDYEKADAVFATTKALAGQVKTQGQPHVYHIPNMVRCSAVLPLRGEFHQPPMIGAMGRFVAKKGFIHFIDALKILYDKGVPFRAILGGEGEELSAIRSRVIEHQMTRIIQLPGWIEDKNAFFSSIDIFCLPSLHEPFGIVLLEAFAQQIPVVTTNSEGPSEIATANFDALMVEKGSAKTLATALESFITQPALAKKLATKAYRTVKSGYDITVVSQKIETALVEIVDSY